MKCFPVVVLLTVEVQLKVTDWPLLTQKLSGRLEYDCEAPLIVTTVPEAEESRPTCANVT